MEENDQSTTVMEAPKKKRKGRAKTASSKTMDIETNTVSRAAPNRVTRRRKRIVIEEDYEDVKPEEDYVPVKFRFNNEEQKGIPVPYEWVDKWCKDGQCKGTFYDGQIYTLPKVAFEYYRDRCSIPKYSNESKEIIPGQMNKVSVETGRIRRFRMDVIQ